MIVPLLLYLRFLEMEEKGWSITHAATSLSEEAGWSQLRDKIVRRMFKRRKRQRRACGSGREATNIKEV